MLSKCQVIFFPIKYIPSEKKLIELQNLQDEITYYHQNIRSNSNSKYDEIARKQALYKRIRDYWELINGDC